MRKLTLALMGAALLITACGGGGPAPAPTGDPVADPVIVIEGVEFQDGSVVVEEGTTVTWEWNDGSVEHNVVSDDGVFESPLQSEGTWSYSFDETGTFPYHCAPHPHMKGTIEVVPAT